MVTNKEIQILNEFLENRNVDYVLTGTAALYYHGLLPKETEVHDIDIIVPTTEETRSALQCMFRELEMLSGCQCDNEYYENRNTLYVFKVGANNIKVNAFEAKPGDYPAFQTMIIDGIPIKVHNALAILKAKFSLRRQKDFDFYLKLSNQLNEMFLCSKK